MLCWSVLLLAVLLMTAATQDSEEQQKEEEEIHNIVAVGRGPPVNVTVMPVLATALNVSWDPPEEEPPHYMVDIGFNNDVTYNTFYFQDGLQACTDYIIVVTSVYDTGEQYQAPTHATTGISVPPPPPKCWFNVTDTTFITAYWSDPSIQCAITNHNISWWSHVLWHDEEGSGNAHTTGNHYIITNLQPYTNVTVSVAAATDIGFGPPTTCWNVTLQDNPGPPVILEVTVSVGSVVVTWTPPGEVNGIITEYMINAVSEEDSVRTSVAGTVLTSVVEDLQEGQTYDITVQARTEAGWGPKSEAWSTMFCDTFPPPPELCWFSNITDNKMVINWIDPFVKCVNNHSISWAWDVLWSDEQGSNVTFSQDTSITLTDLPPYTNVTAQVAAAAAGGFGPPTSCWNVTSPDKMSGTKAMPDVVVMEEQLTQTVLPESPEHDKCETGVHTAP